jgi:putative intracellular protease/amidase
VPSYSDEQLDAAIEALADRERFREAESAVVAAAPKLQGILAQALEAGGWFTESHENEVRKAAAIDDGAERANALRTLLAEEARMGMMVGVAVGWALAEELGRGANEGDSPGAYD